MEGLKENIISDTTTSENEIQFPSCIFYLSSKVDVLNTFVRNLVQFFSRNLIKKLKSTSIFIFWHITFISFSLLNFVYSCFSMTVFYLKFVTINSMKNDWAKVCSLMCLLKSFLKKFINIVTGYLNSFVIYNIFLLSLH